MPKLVDHDRYRRTLLKKAVKSFSERGFEALSMKELADALGISHGLFYHYFKSKEDLFMQMMDRLAQDILSDALASIDATAAIPDRVLAVLGRIEIRDMDMRRLCILAGDYSRIAKGRDAGAPLSRIVTAAREALRDALGVSDYQMDFLFTYGLGIVQGRIMRPESPTYERHGELIRVLLESEMFSRLGAVGTAG